MPVIFISYCLGNVCYCCGSVYCMCIVDVLMDWRYFLLHFLIVDGITGQSICAACLNVIHDEEFLEALSKEWHIDCFRYLILLTFTFVDLVVCTVHMFYLVVHTHVIVWFAVLFAVCFCTVSVMSKLSLSHFTFPFQMFSL